jgi:hypothetical protein
MLIIMNKKIRLALLRMPFLFFLELRNDRFGFFIVKIGDFYFFRSRKQFFVYLFS